MRVCHVVEAGAAGAGNIVLDLARDGVAHGDDVTVFYGSERTWPEFRKNLSALPHIKYAELPMRRAVGWRDIVHATYLNAAFRTFGAFDVIHAHSSKAGALARLLFPLHKKSALIYTPHAFISMAPEAVSFYVWAEKVLSRLCDAIVCVSEQEKQHALDELKISPDKIHLIPNGVDLAFSPLERSVARGRLGLRDSDYAVGFVGRLEAQKNPLRLVHAFAEAAAHKKELQLVIIGQGVLQRDIEQFIAAHNLASRARIVPELNGRSLMPAFDCLVCSSDYESFGLVIVEALAAGVPVVTTPVGIATDAVVSGKNGFVTSDFTVSALASSIVALAEAPPEERARITCAAKNAARNFSIDKMTSATRALYEHLQRQKMKVRA